MPIITLVIFRPQMQPSILRYAVYLGVANKLVALATYIQL
eukprot:COSAG02_NODE_2216_length_9487_cov_916.793460_2_plen_40_part_00